VIMAAKLTGSQGMEELIKQAFLHVEIIGPHVHQGHYDLVGPDGEIILPQVWETMIQPDWAITMHMWPMPEPPPPPKGPSPDDIMLPPPPPDAAHFLAHHLPLVKNKNRKDKPKRRDPVHPHMVQVPPPPSGMMARAPPPPPPPPPLPPAVMVMPIPSSSSGGTSHKKKPAPLPFFRWAAGPTKKPSQKKK
jgi:hypothetical protein